MKSVVIIAAGMAAALLLMPKTDATDSDNPQDQSIMDDAQTALDEAFASAGPVQDMSTSQTMLDMLMRRERYVSQPYNLGDGGWTVGYGHYERSAANLPDCSTPEKGAAVFANDVVNRAEKWVKLYVAVPLTQYQFDALVSVAFNMSPQSFKKFADQVNAGNGIDAIAQDSVSWVAAKFTNGIQNRRNDEMNVYNNGTYA